VAVFTAFSFLVYMLSFKLQRLENKMPFMNLIIVNMMMKFVIAGALVFWYYFTYNPESGTFVIPFLVVYVCFTIFETYFLDKIARS
jgi:hypothetical protein